MHFSLIIFTSFFYLVGISNHAVIKKVNYYILGFLFIALVACVADTAMIFYSVSSRFQWNYHAIMRLTSPLLIGVHFIFALIIYLKQKDGYWKPFLWISPLLGCLWAILLFGNAFSQIASVLYAFIFWIIAGGALYGVAYLLIDDESRYRQHNHNEV